MESDTNDPATTTIGTSKLAAAATQASVYAKNSKAANTVKAYESDWRRFSDWCRTYGRIPLPATTETVTLYVSDLAPRLKYSTLSRCMASICQAHLQADLESPTRDLRVNMVMSGIRRKHGTARASKTALLVGDLRSIISAIPDSLIGRRDRALLLVGFCGAFRRSELVGIDVNDLQLRSQGLEVTIRRSKTDQFGIGRKVGIPYTSTPETCPVRSLQVWMKASGITAGPLFRAVTKEGKVRLGRLVPMRSQEL